MTQRTGSVALLEQLRADGIRYMFGNPGTSEEALLDAMSTFPDIKYILALQETIAVAAADGYARAAGKPALVQLHSGVGLGNGIGMLYQAFRGKSPLVVIAGEAGVQYDALDGQMAADLVAIARPVTKYATRVIHPGSLLRVIRRAFKMAATPPCGPVFVALPQDILAQPNDEPVIPTIIPSTRVVPEPSLITAAADMLKSARSPIILVGDQITVSGAQEELGRLAEAAGAGVWGVNSSEVNLSASHPLFCGLTGHMWGTDSTRILAEADVVLACGTTLFPEVFPSLKDVFRPGAKLIHVDLDAYEIGKNFPVDLGLVADPGLTLAALADAVRSRATDDETNRAAERGRRIADANRSTLEAARRQDAENSGDTPLRLSRFTAELARHLPEDTLIFDEALTSSPELVRHIRPNMPGHYFQTRGGSLGVGIPGALGMKLAHPDKTVVSFSGDGGSMYTIQALWTAVHHGINAKFVICNNRSYRILKLNLLHYWQENGATGEQYPEPFDLGGPDLRFDRLAEAMVVPAVRVERADQIGPAIKRMLSHDGPFLIDLVISGEVPAPKSS